MEDKTKGTLSLEVAIILLFATVAILMGLTGMSKSVYMSEVHDLEISTVEAIMLDRRSVYKED